MNKYIIFAFSIFSLLTFLPISADAQENEVIPIPPKRPNVMNVSPDYVRRLINKKRNTEYLNALPDVEEKEKPVEVIPESKPPPPSKNISPSINYTKKVVNTHLKQESNLNLAGQLVELHGATILSVLEQGGVDLEEQQHTPVPPKKPTSDKAESKPARPPHNSQVIAESPNDNYNMIQPSSGPSEQTVVSFMLEDEQIYLNEDLKVFLNEYAINLFRDNTALVMDIQAYAPLLEGQDFSDVRVSLARALEVRSYLIEHNISPTRLKISPMGQDKTSNVDNRIDLVFID